MEIDGAKFVADISGCSAWTMWHDGVVIVWPDRNPQYFTRDESGEWSGEEVTPPDWPMTTVMVDTGRFVWMNP